MSKIIRRISPCPIDGSPLRRCRIAAMPHRGVAVGVGGAAGVAACVADGCAVGVADGAIVNDGTFGAVAGVAGVAGFAGVAAGFAGVAGSAGVAAGFAGVAAGFAGGLAAGCAGGNDGAFGAVVITSAPKASASKTAPKAP